ncbi:hypothetical protein [Treponema sp. OMZ 789]|uniref:hypothetical protein n=1 Tax=Treponema sp. OMZ 789 TaxID=2563670 RepID=UPI0020A40186|nr:hypothetical protein [Treponema sp. OMZ 789]UTC67194.1 hypothetical protein E4O06_00530 [Treponema sp. OMZ 789]
MKDLLNNGFQPVSETEMMMVDGGCPCPFCPGDDSDGGTPLPVPPAPNPPQDPPGIRLPGGVIIGPVNPPNGGIGIGITIPLPPRRRR